MRIRSAALAAAIGATGLAGGLTLVSGPVAAQAGPTITVTPSTDLQAGDVVTIEATGFTPAGASVGTAQCAVDMQALRQDCDQTTAKIVAVDADGGFTSEHTITVGPMGPGGRSCDAGAPCLITAQVIGDVQQQARFEVTLAADDAGATTTEPAPADDTDDAEDDEAAADTDDDDSSSALPIVLGVVAVVVLAGGGIALARRRGAAG